MRQGLGVCCQMARPTAKRCPQGSFSQIFFVLNFLWPGPRFDEMLSNTFKTHIYEEKENGKSHKEL